ncbi:MAG: leucine-rich repeat protein [Candidatus Ornithospirochaeta sp.]
MKKTFLLVPLAIILVMSLFLVSCEDEPELKSYTVTFLLDEGDTEPFDKKTVLEGAGITDAKVPEKTGHKFLHWKNVGGNDVYELNTPVKGDLTLVAVWETNKYTVSFMDGETKAADPQTVEYGKKATAPEVSPKDGHTLSWKKVGSSSPFDFAKEVITENTVLEAVWDTNKYTVSFMDGETKASDPQTVEYGKTATAPTAPTKEGHTFNCWRKVGSSSPFNFETEVITENTVLEAVWDINTYTVTFYNEDGTSIYSTTSANHGQQFSSVVQPTPEKTGHVLIGWATEKGSKKAYGSSEAIEGNVNLYPIWEKGQYKVSFICGEGAEKVPQVQPVEFEGKAKEPETIPTKTGYTFKYWATSTESKTEYSFDTPVVDNLILYSVWEKNTYTVTFTGGEGISNVPTSQSVKYEEKATNPETKPTRTGYTFKYWATSIESKTEYSFDTLVVDNLTLYPVWEKNTYSVTFTGGEGISNVPPIQSVKYEEKATNPDTIPTKTGYTFKYWATSAESKTEYSFDTLVVDNLTLYPVFEISKFTVTFVGADGISSDLVAQTVEYNSTATDPNPTVNEGYQLFGWKMEGSEKYFNFETRITSSITLYADCRDITKVNVSFYDGNRLLSSGQYNCNEDIVFPTFDDIGTGCTITKWILADDKTEHIGSFNLPYKEDGYRFNAYIEAQYLTIDSNGKIDSITNLNSYDVSSLVIPHSINGIAVRSIKYNAFSGCKKISSITIPDCVTFIGASAFYGCTGLTSITIPASVTSIEYSTFAYCSNLKSINVSSDNTSFSSEDGVWFDKDKKRLICFPAGKDVTEYTIPDTVTTIDRDAFIGCANLTKIIIPESVTSIGFSAFSDCTSLQEITIPGSVKELYSTFKGCTSLKKVSIKEGVEVISNAVFESCTSLTDISLPNGLTTIGSYVFKGCTGLTSITIPSSVTSIGDNAFLSCGLTSITIPENVTAIGKGALSTSSLETITVSSINSSFSDVDGVLFDKKGLKIICFPAGKQVISYTIPDGVTSIGKAAFANCSNLTEIIIPNTVTSIETIAFSGSGLTSVSIPSSVKNIVEYTFNNCLSLNSISLSNGVETIGDKAFYNCTSLSGLEFPDSVTSIGEEALFNCIGITNLTIPNSVTSIHKYAFRNCKNLTQITINKNKDDIAYAPWGGDRYLSNGTYGNSTSKQIRIIWANASKYY